MVGHAQLAHLDVTIVRFVDEYQPGFIACKFLDAIGRIHAFVGKVPIFSSEDLDASSEYPRQGAVRCSILEAWRDSEGRDLVCISTDEPDAEQSTEGLTEFVVLDSQLSRDYSA